MSTATNFNLPPLINIIEISSKAPSSPSSSLSPKLDDIFLTWNKSAQDGGYRNWAPSIQSSPRIPQQSRSFSFCYGSPFTSNDSFSSSPSSINNMFSTPVIRKHSVPSHTFRSPYSPPHSPSFARHHHHYNMSSLPHSPNPNCQNGKKMRLNFSKHTTTILKDWLYTNLAHPFPTEQQKLNLSMLTGLTIEQINNWFINGRRRLLTIKKDSNYRKYFKIKN